MVEGLSWGMWKGYRGGGKEGGENICINFKLPVCLASCLTVEMKITKWFNSKEIYVVCWNDMCFNVYVFSHIITCIVMLRKILFWYFLSPNLAYSVDSGILKIVNFILLEEILILIFLACPFNSLIFLGDWHDFANWFYRIRKK